MQIDYSTILTITLIGYLIGSLQPAYIIGKLFKGTDIREHGSKNAGASNAVLLFGWQIGLFAGLIDIFKATVSVLIVKSMFVGHENLDVMMFFTGLMTIIGHNYPFYMGFKGGKGTASLVGMMFGIELIYGIIIAAQILITMKITKYIVLGTMGAYIILMGWSIYNGNIYIIIMSLFLSYLGVSKHWENLIRIRKGEEHSLDDVK